MEKGWPGVTTEGTWHLETWYRWKVGRKELKVCAKFCFVYNQLNCNPTQWDSQIQMGQVHYKQRIKENLHFVIHLLLTSHVYCPEKNLRKKNLKRLKHDWNQKLCRTKAHQLVLCGRRYLNSASPWHSISSIGLK